MKLCTACGANNPEGSSYCSYCGNFIGNSASQGVAQEQLPPGGYPCGPYGYQHPYGGYDYWYWETLKKQYNQNKFLDVAIIFFLIISWGICIPFYGITLLWQIPLTVILIRKMINGEYITSLYKIIILLLVSPISGILLLFRSDMSYPYHQPFMVAPSLNDGINGFVKLHTGFSCVLSIAFLGIPLLWIIPMTKAAFRKMETGEYIDTKFKVLYMIFVNIVGGIFLLVRQEYLPNYNYQS